MKLVEECKKTGICTASYLRRTRHAQDLIFIRSIYAFSKQAVMRISIVLSGDTTSTRLYQTNVEGAYRYLCFGSPSSAYEIHNSGLTSYSCKCTCLNIYKLWLATILAWTQELPYACLIALLISSFMAFMNRNFRRSYLMDTSSLKIICRHCGKLNENSSYDESNESQLPITQVMTGQIWYIPTHLIP